MPAKFLDLPAEERRDIINALSGELGLLPEVVEKDVWVCFALDVLFSIPNRRPMVFKGGTSLSKAYSLIKRFSEDIDISVNFIDDYGTPISKTKANSYRDEIEAKLQAYKEGVIMPAFGAVANRFDLDVKAGDTNWEIHINYKSVLESGKDYIKTRVKIELSGRNETEPSTRQLIRPYLASAVEDLDFPEATVDTLAAERTFWEKVTLIHAAIHSRTIEQSAERLSRHWSDLTILMHSEIGPRAIADRDLCARVVDHKDKFWRDGAAKYDDCRTKKFKLAPEGQALAALKADYEAMVASGMFLDENPADFQSMITEIRELEKLLNI